MSAGATPQPNGSDWKKNSNVVAVVPVVPAAAFCVFDMQQQLSTLRSIVVSIPAHHARVVAGEITDLDNTGGARVMQVEG